MFVAGTADWSVRNLEDGDYPVFVVWAPNGKMLGVAGSRDGLGELFVDVVRDYEKALAAKKRYPTAYKMVGIRITTRGKIVVEELVGVIVRDDAPDADQFGDIGKGGFGAPHTDHHVEVHRLRRKRSPREKR